MREQRPRIRLPIKSVLSLGRGTVILIGFNPTNVTWVRQFLNGSKATIRRSGKSRATVTLLRFLVFAKFVTYGYGVNSKIAAFTKKSKRGVFYEDGFIRNFWAPKGIAPSPISACFDHKGLHFDRHVVTDFDLLLNSIGEQSEGLDLDLARNLMRKYLSVGATKYGAGDGGTLARKRVVESRSTQPVVVLGQVPSDSSMIYGRRNRLTFNELIEIAALENPDSEVIFRPHPRAYPNNLERVLHPAARLSGEGNSLLEDIKEAKSVYTFSSQAGFDSLLRGKRVSVFGTPFYAGWGLTDDREHFVPGKRNVSLSIEELFWGAYVVYPRYLSLGFPRISSTLESLLDGFKTLAQSVSRVEPTKMEGCLDCARTD